MTAPAALPSHVRDDEGAVLTFIVPAEKCNLSCSYCFIKLREEKTNEIVLSVEDYRKFILEIAATRKIAAICIQGHEPLLPESFKYTEEILSIGRELVVPTSIVTNGTLLRERVNELKQLRPDRIAVSIDSHLSDLHDKKRGKIGAFNATISGIRATTLIPELHQAMSVTSVLIPKKKDHLTGMPELLSTLQISQWNVNILISFSKASSSSTLSKRDIIIKDLKDLNFIANRYHVNMIVDDEFKSLGDCNEERYLQDSKALRIKRLLNPSGVIRLLPNGQCSVGVEIMQKQRSQSPRWHPSWINAGDFVEQLTSHRTNALC